MVNTLGGAGTDRSVTQMVGRSHFPRTLARALLYWADAVMKTTHSFAGPNPKFGERAVLVKGTDGVNHFMPMLIACKPEGGCVAIALDGASYTDLQDFVDDSKLIKPGDEVFGTADLTSPGSPQNRAETFTKHVTPPWVWYVGGGVLLVLSVVGAVWLEARTRHRRADE